MKIKVAIFCGCAILFPVMRDMIWINNWEKFLGETKAACNYWELGFGDLCAVEETDIIRQCFVNGDDVDTACDAWRDFVMEHMYEKAL